MDIDRRQIVTGRLAVSVLVPFAIGFFLSNYYRSMNAVLSPRLMSDLGLSATNLGLLTSIYFFTTAIFQLPLGLLIDRYGPRRVQSIMMAVASAGVMIFALGTQLPTMMLGRAIMGVGGAGALTTAFQAVIFWLPAARWPFFNGLVLSAGGLGALAATLPTELILHVTDWRRLMIGVAAASLASAALIAGLVPERAAARNTDTLHKQLRDLALQLHCLFEMCTACFGLVGAPPE